MINFLQRLLSWFSGKNSWINCDRSMYIYKNKNKLDAIAEKMSTRSSPAETGYNERLDCAEIFTPQGEVLARIKMEGEVGVADLAEVTMLSMKDEHKQLFIDGLPMKVIFRERNLWESDGSYYVLLFRRNIEEIAFKLSMNTKFKEGIISRFNEEKGEAEIFLKDSGDHPSGVLFSITVSGEVCTPEKMEVICKYPISQETQEIFIRSIPVGLKISFKILDD